MSDATKDKLVIAGVRNLKEFGYPNVTAANILTDQIYSSLFKAMLEENREHGVDAEIAELLAEIERAA
jgi:hypothetical protein